MRIEHSIEIDAPIERVWELTLDVEAWPEHSPSMTSVELLDDGLLVGSRARVKQPARGAKVWTVTALVPRKRFTWTTKSMGTVMTASHHLAETADGTTNTLTIDIEGALAPVIGFLLRRPIRGAITKENEGFKAWAEGTASESTSLAAPAS